MKRTLIPRDAYAEARKRLRPGRVVAVDEHRLGAVDRERLRVRGDALDRELQRPPLFDRALRQHARPPGLGADEDRHRVQRRVARDADRRLDLGETARRRLGGVGREQRRVLLQVRDVRLVRRGTAGAQLLQGEHHLDGIEQRDHARQPRRRQPARKPDELLARHVDVDEPMGELVVGQGHRLGGHFEVETVARDEVVDRVEVLCAPSVEPDNAAVLDLETGLRIVRAVHRDEPEVGVAA